MTAPASFRTIIDRFLHDKDGQGLTEYALILALIALIAVVALVFMGNQLSTELNIIGSQVQSVQN